MPAYLGVVLPYAHCPARLLGESRSTVTMARYG